MSRQRRVNRAQVSASTYSAMQESIRSVSVLANPSMISAARTNSWALPRRPLRSAGLQRVTFPVPRISQTRPGCGSQGRNGRRRGDRIAANVRQDRRVMLELIPDLGCLVVNDRGAVSRPFGDVTYELALLRAPPGAARLDSVGSHRKDVHLAVRRHASSGCRLEHRRVFGRDRPRSDHVADAKVQVSGESGQGDDQCRGDVVSVQRVHPGIARAPATDNPLIREAYAGVAEASLAAPAGNGADLGSRELDFGAREDGKNLAVDRLRHDREWSLEMHGPMPEGSLEKCR